MSYECSKCKKSIRLSYLTNKGETVCEACSWWWLTDEVANVLIDPDTVHMTKDQYLEMGRRYGFIDR